MNSQIETLAPLFNPKSIAIIGATSDLTKIGGRPVKALLDFNFQGKIYPVNPKYNKIAGIPCYSNVQQIPDEIDLAIIVVPGSMAVNAVRECGVHGVRSVIVVSAGFAEVGKEGAELEAEISRLGNEHNMRILGPNTVGMFNLLTGAIANFGVYPQLGDVPKGKISFVSQSGALCALVYTLAAQRQIGLNYFIGTGNQSDIDVADCIAYLADDPDTDVIGCYIEGVDNTDKLLEALALAKQNKKHVIAIKGGRSELGKKAVLAHTATQVSSDSIYDSIFKENGVYQVESIQELLDVAHACSNTALPTGKRVAVFTISGAVGVMLSDQFSDLGLTVPQTDQETEKKLLDLIPYASVPNPIDVTGQLVNQPQLLGDFMQTVLSNGSYDMVMTYISDLGYNKTILQQFLDAIEEVKELHPHIPHLLSTVITPETGRMAYDSEVPIYDDPLRMAKAAKALGEIGEKIAVST